MDRAPTVMENHEKNMEIEKIKSRPGKVTENEDFAKVMKKSWNLDFL